MLNYFIKRILLALLTILIVSFVSVALTSLSKISPLDVKKNKLFLASADRASQIASQVENEDKQNSIFKNYLVWLDGAKQLDFGESASYDQKVSSLVIDRMGNSLSYFIITFIFVVVFSIILGLLKAVYFSRSLNRATDFILYMVNIMPIYILAIFLLLIFSSNHFLGIFPLGGMHSDKYANLGFWQKVLDNLYYGFLPILCYFLCAVTEFVFLMKNTAKETMKKDFIKTAVAKGLSRRKIIFDHVLRYSLIPIFSHLNTLVLILISSSMIIENVFNINGIGSLSYKVILDRDFNTLIFINVLIAIVVVVVRGISDGLIRFLDHRIDWES